MESGKFPLKLVDANLKRAITVLEIDLNRLDKHRHNIEKSRLDITSLREEHLKAGTTVQQLKANVKALETLRCQVKDEDIAKFDSKTEAIREKTAIVTSQFAHVTHEVVPLNNANLVSFSSQNNHDTTATNNSEEHFHACLENSTGDEQAPLSGQLQIQAEPHLSEDGTDETWQTLETNVLELNGLVREFSTLVHDQGAVIDSIEDNVENAAENVNEGGGNLAKAAKYSAAVYPVAGALVGTLVGGPIGFVAGLKIGALAAAGGSIAGFTGGRFMQRKKTQQIDCDEQMRMTEHSEPISNDIRDDSTVNPT